MDNEQKMPVPAVNDTKADEKAKKVIRYDFTVKPWRPTFLMQVAKWIVGWPDLARRQYTINKHNMEDIEDKPYLLLSNHASMVDFSLMLRATHPHPVNNVMSIECFHIYTNPVCKMLGCMGKRKFVQDFNLIRNIKYCLHTLGDIFCMYPEARYSLEGKTSYLPDSLGKLVKLMKVPVVVFNMKGNYVTCPQWNKYQKKSPVIADMTQIISAEEAASLSADELNERIKKAFEYDDFRWQKENGIVIDHPKRAENLHKLLYKCPHCKKEFEMASAGTELWCKACGRKWEMTELGELRAKEGETEFSHIPDWTDWERECAAEEIRNGTYKIEKKVRVDTLPHPLFPYRRQGVGTFRQDLEGTRILLDSYYGGKPFELFRPAGELDSIHIEYDFRHISDALEVSLPDDSFWCFFENDGMITKVAFAVEELYKQSCGRMNGENGN